MSGESTLKGGSTLPRQMQFQRLRGWLESRMALDSQPLTGRPSVDTQDHPWNWLRLLAAIVIAPGQGAPRLACYRLRLWSASATG